MNSFSQAKGRKSNSFSQEYGRRNVIFSQKRGRGFVISAKNGGGIGGRGGNFSQEWRRNMGED
jgi:hypothetical protein